jgi:CDGSH-type Zn-finger protein
MSDDDITQPDVPPKITLTKGGPYLVEGCPIYDADGNMIASKGALCACGKSKNKPFCDGSHKSE